MKIISQLLKKMIRSNNKNQKKIKKKKFNRQNKKMTINNKKNKVFHYLFKTKYYFILKNRR